MADGVVPLQISGVVFVVTAHLIQTPNTPTFTNPEAAYIDTSTFYVPFTPGHNQKLSWAFR